MKYLKKRCKGGGGYRYLSLSLVAGLPGEAAGVAHHPPAGGDLLRVANTLPTEMAHNRHLLAGLPTSLEKNVKLF